MLQRNVSRLTICDKARGAAMTYSGSGLVQQGAGKRHNNPPVVIRESGDKVRRAVDAEM
jgi:hypothetical protein